LSVPPWSYLGICGHPDNPFVHASLKIYHFSNSSSITMGVVNIIQIEHAEVSQLTSLFTVDNIITATLFVT
jgi:hypothetical protein